MVAAVLAAAVELEADLEEEQEVAVVVAEVALVSFNLQSSAFRIWLKNSHSISWIID